MPKKLRLWSILLLVGVAPMFRLTMVLEHWGRHDTMDSWLTPANLDSLGIGALLAYADREPFIAPSLLARVLLVFGLAGFALNYATSWAGALKQTFCASIFGWLIWNASQGFAGRFGKFLQCRPVAYFGRISYGVYVIHMFGMWFWFWLLYGAPVPGYRVFARLHVPPAVYGQGAVTLIMMAAITGVLAAWSFRFYESPINNLKRYFPYLKSSSARDPM